MDNKRCESIQINKNIPDYECKFNDGHGGPHVDPVTGIAWNHPETPYGMRRKPRK